jgi:hypothetical protein
VAALLAQSTHINHLNELFKAGFKQFSTNYQRQETSFNRVKKSIQLLGEILKYYLYYFLIYFFLLETCISLYYLVLNFYQINEDCEIQTHDRLIIKILILYQKINLI